MPDSRPDIDEGERIHKRMISGEAYMRAAWRGWLWDNGPALLRELREHREAARASSSPAQKPEDRCAKCSYRRDDLIHHDERLQRFHRFASPSGHGQAELVAKIRAACAKRFGESCYSEPLDNLIYNALEIEVGFEACKSIAAALESWAPARSELSLTDEQVKRAFHEYMGGEEFDNPDGLDAMRRALLAAREA